MTAAAIVLKVTLILIVALAVTRFTRRSRAAVRHALLAAAFGVALILPIASFVAPSVQIAMPSVVQEAIGPLQGDPVVETAEPIAAVAGASANRNAGARWAWPTSSTLLGGVWLGGIVVFLLPVALGLARVGALRRSALPWLEGRTTIDLLARTAGIQRRVDLLLHESLPGPMTCGVMRPAVVLPADARTWPTEDLRRALVHELEHVRRGDWMSQVLARIVAAFYWFHPVVWMAWRQLSLEAERACDDAVLVTAEPDAAAYADQLVHLAQRLSSASHRPQLAMANRNDLTTRVVAVLDSHQRRGRVGAPWVALVTAGAAIVIAAMSPLRLVASRQTPQAPAATGARLAYDTVSVKPCVAEENPTGARGTAGGTNATASPGRFFVPCVTTGQLVYLAYAAYGVSAAEHLTNDNPGGAADAIKVRGGPSWVHSLRDKYSIEATAPGVTDRLVLMGAMLRTLLEDRFKLKLHRDVEQVPMYSLVVAKGGLKLKPVKAGDCEPIDMSAPMEMFPTKPKCGMLNMNVVDGKTVWTFGSMPLSNLASRLSSALKMHVIDNTRIKDEFVFRFEFPRDPDSLINESAIFAALEEQLGLKLEKVTAPRGFLVIDAIERPRPDPPFAPIPSRARPSGRPSI